MYASVYQKRFWLDWQLAPESSYYNEALTFSLEGPLDQDRLVQAFSGLMHRHPLLRSQFEQKKGNLLLKLLPSPVLPLHCIAILPEELEARTEQIIAEPFDLKCGPLWRASLFQYADQRWRLVMVFHHIIFGGNVYGLLRKDLMRFYNEPNEVAKLKPPMHYDRFLRDYLKLEYKTTQEASVSGMDYYRRSLKGKTLAYNMAGGDLLKTTIAFTLDVKTKLLMLDYCQKHRCAPFRLMSAVFGIFLYQVFGFQSGCLTYPISTKPSGYGQLMGSFINMQLLPLKLGVKDTFETVLAQVVAARRATRNLLLPFEVILQRLRQENIVGSQDKPNVIISETDLNFARLDFKGVLAQRLYRHKPHIPYDFMFEYDLSGDGIEVVLNTKNNWGDIQELSRIFAMALTNLLREVTLNPQRIIDELKSCPDILAFREAFLLQQRQCLDLGASKQKVNAQVSPTSIQPADQTLQRVLKIWGELLPGSGFKAEDNFFDCGGDSILLTYLQWHIKNTFGVEFEMVNFFRYPSAGQMSNFIDRFLSG